MRTQDFAVGIVLLGLAALGVAACDDGGGGDAPPEEVTDGDETDSDVISSVEYRDRAVLILDNEDSILSLIEASEDTSVGFGAIDNELILQGSEQNGSSVWHFVGANGGDDLLMGTEAFTVRYRDDDSNGTGELEILDGTEAQLAIRDDVTLDAEEVAVLPGRDVDRVIEALEATESDLTRGRWRSLATAATELLEATESTPEDLDGNIENLLLTGTESIQVIREGLLRAEEDLATGGAPTGPDVFRVPEENDGFLVGIEAVALLDSGSRGSFRDQITGIARELLLFAADEAVPGNFLPTMLLALDGTEVTVEVVPDIPFTGAKQVSIGSSHTCAIDLNDQLFCWGGNDSGQLGTGNRISEPEPRSLGETTWQRVALGFQTSCAIDDSTDPRGLCWGDNTSGQVAIDLDVESSLSPTSTGQSDVRALDTGQGHSCSVNSMGALFCWGSNSNGQLGVPAVNGSTFVPTQVGTSTNWSTVSTGAIHTCAINDNQELFCWGFNTDGRAGLGESPEADVPTQVGADTWKQVSAGGSLTCGINTADELFCWGANGFGQLGNNSTAGADIPTQVAGTSLWSVVSTGFLHACAVRTDGSLFCWGSNFGGRLGLGDTQQREVPTQIGLETWTNVSSGTDHSCAIRSDDSSLWCWGKNDVGQLGDGTTDLSLEPVPVVE